MGHRIITAFAGLFCAVLPAFAQGQAAGEDPAGTLTYSLPSTTILIEVEAVQENFFAGPYAAYADKYLGIKAGQQDRVTCSISEVRMTPYMEADQSRRYILNPKGKDAVATMLRLTSEGLVSMTEGGQGKAYEWRFPAAAHGDFAGKGLTSNLTAESATLYRNSKSGSAFSKVAVRQDMVVEKSLEKRAAEAARLIFDLRKQRLQIITGDTDATYSGEAMGAAIAELARLEEEYMMMFTGYSEFRTMRKTFEIVPQKDRESQMYVAFRISDTDGLLLPDNLSGRPVILEIAPQEVPSVAVDKKDAKGTKAPSVTYRVPAACTVRLLDGRDVVMQSRMLVYQLGRESTCPVNVIVE